MPANKQVLWSKKDDEKWSHTNKKFFSNQKQNFFYWMTWLFFSSMIDKLRDIIRIIEIILNEILIFTFFSYMCMVWIQVYFVCLFVIFFGGPKLTWPTTTTTYFINLNYHFFTKQLTTFIYSHHYHHFIKITVLLVILFCLFVCPIQFIRCMRDV